MGIVVYADDVFLLAPSRRAAQIMLDICQQFADNNNIKFSTDPDPIKSKSKAMYVVGQRQLVQPPVPLVLCGSPLPWVERCGHLGHLLSTDGSMDHDCRKRRAEFIDNTVKIREMFSFAYPSEIIAAIDKHCCSFYGSSLYNL